MFRLTKSTIRYGNNTTQNSQQSHTQHHTTLTQHTTPTSQHTHTLKNSHNTLTTLTTSHNITHNIIQHRTQHLQHHIQHQTTSQHLHNINIIYFGLFVQFCLLICLLFFVLDMLGNLPQSIQEQIIMLIGLDSLGILGRVCKSWKSFVLSENIWRMFTIARCVVLCYVWFCLFCLVLVKQYYGTVLHNSACEACAQHTWCAQRVLRTSSRAKCVCGLINLFF